MYRGSMVNHLSGIAFSDQVIQRTSPTFARILYHITSLPCLQGSFHWLNLSSCLCTVALREYVKLQSRALIYLLRCRIHSMLGCSLCRMSDGMGELQNHEEDGNMDGLSQFSGFHL